MKHVSIVVPTGGALTGIEVARHIFAEVNDYLVNEGQEPLFNVKLVGAWPAIQLNNGLFTIQVDATIHNTWKTDLIIIPALHVNVAENVNNNKDLVEWIRQQYLKGAEVASLCVGAFLLAKTGLLNGKQCTTHWKAAATFQDLYPEVTLVKEKIITDEKGLYSSGGSLSMVNLLVYLVEKYAGRDAAIYCAKFFQVDLERTAQLPFIIFQGQKEHTDDSVKQAQEFIENNFQQKIKVDQLAEMLAVGRRSLERRFKKATSNTMNEYIQRVKIEAAKKHLEASHRKINDIMYDVGYSDTKTFRNSFKLVTGLLPNEYRNRYNKKMAEV